MRGDCQCGGMDYRFGSHLKHHVAGTSLNDNHKSNHATRVIVNDVDKKCGGMDYGFRIRCGVQVHKANNMCRHRLRTSACDRQDWKRLDFSVPMASLPPLLEHGWVR
jgi:hypothetical protein